MTLPDPSPRLPKWPFLAGDTALLAAAWIVSERAAHPMGIDAIFAITFCVLGAAVLGAIPFLVEYARRQDEALDERQRSLEALARTAAEAADQISIAAKGFHEIADLAHKNLKQAEQLPHKLQEKIAEFHSKFSNALQDEKDELEKELAALRSSESERLESTADKVAKITAEWGRIEGATLKHAAAAKAILVEFDKRVGGLKSAAGAPSLSPDSPSAIPDKEEPAPKPKSPAAPANEVKPEPPSEAKTEKAAPAAESLPKPESSAESPAEADSPAEPAAVEVPKAARKRAARKPKTDTPPSEAPEAFSLDAIDSLEFSQTASADAAPVVSVSADGATRLIVTAYIGIGNRLFIRGEGPGLAWDQGVPLQFVSIGKWRWESAEATAPVRFKLYKNDQAECTSLNAPPLEPGQQQEITATF